MLPVSESRVSRLKMSNKISNSPAFISWLATSMELSALGPGTTGQGSSSCHDLKNHVRARLGIRSHARLILPVTNFDLLTPSPKSDLISVYSHFDSKLCDVTKVAACGIVATGRLGRVEEIVLMRSHNFMRSTKLLLN